jgi:hypothetical protein
MASSLRAHVAAAQLAAQRILHHLPTEYLRKRLTGPRQALLALLISIQSGVNRIGLRPVRLSMIAHLDGMLGWTPQKTPSTRSMFIALKKLLPMELEAVLQVAIGEVLALNRDRMLVHGRLVVAIDGVHLNARRSGELARKFGRPKQGDDQRAHQPQAMVVTARCVITGATLAQEIVRHDGSERAAAKRMLDRLQGMGRLVILLDRGFPARDLVGLMCERKIEFVVRMCGGKRAWRELHGMTDGDARDAAVPMKLRDARGRWFTNELRVILTEKPSRGRPRCDRTPKRLLLLTNLRGACWKTQRVVDLYLRRWDIEISFREDKRLLGAALSRALTGDGFLREVYALQIYRSLMVIVGAFVGQLRSPVIWHQATRRRTSTPQILVIAWIMILDGAQGPVQGAERLTWLAEQAQRDAEKRRPGRAFARECKGVEGAWKNKVERRAG